MAAKPTPGTGNQPPDLSSLGLSITEHAPLSMATVEGASHIVRYVNPAFCRLIDRSKDQLVGKSFCEMLPEKDECVTLLDRVFRTGKPESHREPEHSEPHPIFWSYTAWPVIGNERPVGVIIQVSESAEVHEKTLAMNEALILGSVRQHELTEAAEALEQRRKDQLQFKDEFLSHVSHELRSPLTAIKQFTSILLGGSAGELNKEQREYQEIVQKNIGQLQSMIDDLLEVTRLETGKLTVEPGIVFVADAVTDIINTIEGTARAKGVTLSCDLSPDLPRAHADRTRLRQILIILLDNAIKFTPDGGAVTIQARLLEQDPRFLVLEVSDTGCGISPEIAEKIFDRLYQVAGGQSASRKGLGLGLYICKELVTRQGGQIWVKSQQLKGSTFSFTLPVFSLNTVIAPLFKNDKWPAQSVALVKVETRLRGAWPSKESQEGWSHEARGLLQRCLLPDLDVLLPQMSSGAEGERFFVAAFKDEKGASILANRIRQQFEQLPHLKQTGLTVAVSYRMLPLPQDVGASIENILTSMATNLEVSIKSQIISEVDHE
jgi:two-component system NtrC family sensor kinase